MTLTLSWMKAREKFMLNPKNKPQFLEMITVKLNSGV